MGKECGKKEEKGRNKEREYDMMSEGKRDGRGEEGREEEEKERKKEEVNEKNELR